MTQNLDLDLSYDVVTETGKAVLPLLKETSDVESLPNGTWDPQADDPEGLFARQPQALTRIPFLQTPQVCAPGV